MRNLFPAPPYQCSTGNTASAQHALRDASVGTSKRQSRLVFDPYSQVKQTICTSELLQTSSGLSPAFILLRNRSTGF